MTTDNEQKVQLKKFLQKNKNQLELKDWFVLITSMGLTPEVISQASGLAIPSNLYYFIEEQRNKFVKKAEDVLYETSMYPETLCLYFDHNKAKNELKSDYEFKGKVLGVLSNKTDHNKKNILILDQSCFYPVSGGQLNDTGKILIEGKEYKVINVEKVGKCVLHYID